MKIIFDFKICVSDAMGLGLMCFHNQSYPHDFRYLKNYGLFLSKRNNLKDSSSEFILFQHGPQLQ